MFWAPLSAVLTQQKRKNRIGQRKASRKIANEVELVDMARKEFPDCDVQPMAFENLSPEQQIQAIRDTDVLIGMHGMIPAVSSRRFCV
jgi:hypothetical protein